MGEHRKRMRSFFPKPFQNVCTRGFTLVEICIAIAVFGFAILSIFGLLNVALSTSGNAQRESSQASIIRTLEVDVRSTTSATGTATLTATPFYYDIAGTQTTSASSTAFYKVNLTLTSTTAVQSLLPLQNSSGNLYLWSAKIAYPPPNYPFNTVVLLGNASY